MSASRRARASFTVAVRIDASGAAFTDLGSGRSVCLGAFGGGRDDRDDQTKRERDTAGELGEGRDPGPEPWGPHTHTRDALSPARKARASPHAQNFLRSVCRDDETDNGTHERECEIG